MNGGYIQTMFSGLVAFVIGACFALFLLLCCCHDNDYDCGPAGHTRKVIVNNEYVYQTCQEDGEWLTHEEDEGVFLD